MGDAAGIAVVEPVAARRDVLGAELAGVTVTDALAGPADGVVLAVKPGDVAAAARVAATAGATRVLSIAAGVTTHAIEDALGTDAAVVRAMPNTPALVGAGASAIAPGRHAGDDDLDWAEGILGAVGTVVRVPEHLLDAVTGLSGSGPAYLFLVAEALIDAGVLVGLPRDVSRALATQLLVGSAALLAESGETPETLRAASRRRAARPPPGSGSSRAPACGRASWRLWRRPRSAVECSAERDLRADFSVRNRSDAFLIDVIGVLSAASGVRVGPHGRRPSERAEGGLQGPAPSGAGRRRRPTTGCAGRAGAVGGSAPALFVPPVMCRTGRAIRFRRSVQAWAAGTTPSRSSPTTASTTSSSAS